MKCDEFPAESVTFKNEASFTEGHCVLFSPHDLTVIIIHIKIYICKTIF